MRTKKRRVNKCQNPSCRCSFEPNKFHPDQKYCGRMKCRRYAGRKRQQKHYKKNSDNEEFQRELSKRKARERLRRKDRKKEAQKASENVLISKQPTNIPCTSLLGVHFFKGFISFQTGCLDAEDINAFICKCNNRGKDLTLNNSLIIND